MLAGLPLPGTGKAMAGATAATARMNSTENLKRNMLNLYRDECVNLAINAQKLCRLSYERDVE